MRFLHIAPSCDAYWRAIILFGRNAASYKFALGQVFLEFAQQGKTTVRLDEVALPYARQLCAHLNLAPRQGTAPTSRFLSACRDFNAGVISQEQLIETTVRLGFVNVLDAFHVVNDAPIPKPFFLADRGSTGSLTLTD